MDPVTSAALISTGGALVSNAMASGQSTKERAFNRIEAQKNRDFQERMSSTAYQRMRQDLEKAGLNPLLGISSGGASSPSGSSASTTATPVQDFLGQGIATALQAKQLQENLKLTKAQTAKTNMETAVASKAIPEAEAKNIIWEKVKGATKTGAKVFEQVLKDAGNAWFPKHPPVKHNFPKQ